MANIIKYKGSLYKRVDKATFDVNNIEPAISKVARFINYDLDFHILDQEKKILSQIEAKLQGFRKDLPNKGEQALMELEKAELNFDILLGEIVKLEKSIRNARNQVKSIVEAL